ncbi:MAG: DNA polymerase Y family protein [Actinomycetota bacterium]
MERTICVWYPAWALRYPGVSQGEPAQAVGQDNRVVACNEEASAHGVTIGMSRRSAEAICPTIVTVVQDLSLEMARFEPVVQAIETLVPRVEVAEPGVVYIPVSGAVVYYGGEEALCERLDKELDQFGGDRRFGLAAGPFASYQAARQTTGESPIHIVLDDESFIANLDVSTLGSEDLAATFRWLGITTLGAVADLPRDAVATRFGRTGLDAHRAALGLDRDVSPRSVPTDPTVEAHFDPPIENFEQASFAARNLAQRLVGKLAPHGIAPHRVMVSAVAGDGTERSRTWRSADPFTEGSLAERVRWQIRSWIEGVSAGIRGGLITLRLEPADLSGSGRQLALSEDVKGAEEAQRALMEVQAIAGEDNMLVASPQGGRDPGEQMRWTRWGEDSDATERDIAAPWPGQIPSPAPALVPPEPVPFTVDWVGGVPDQVRLRSRWVPVLSWAGPWRRVGRWWDGEGSSDRFQIVTSVGAYLCEVREGRTYLLGVYD